MKKTLSIFTRPVPMWLFALWIAGGMSVAALAAVPLYTGSLSVPATGTNTENQLSASQCIGTDASKVEKSNSNCVQSVTGTANQVNTTGATGAITLSLPQSIATTSSPTFQGLSVVLSSSGALGPILSLTNNNSAVNTAEAVQFIQDAGGVAGEVKAIRTNSGTGAADVVISCYKASVGKTECGRFTDQGQFQSPNGIQTASDGTTKSFVGPAYTTAGAAVASTWHSVKGTCTAAASTSCAVTFTGAAVFASASSYACEASNADNVSTTTFKTFANASGSGTTLFFTAADSSTWSFVCSGT